MNENGVPVDGKFVIPLTELEISAVRAQGPGGQNVNKVSSAIQLRFRIADSSLPAWCRQRLLEMRDSRITRDGEVVIKAQRYRTQERNREDAIERLVALVEKALETQKPRVATKPSRASKTRRLDAKSHRGRIKSLRGKVET